MSPRTGRAVRFAVLRRVASVLRPWAGRLGVVTVLVSVQSLLALVPVVLVGEMTRSLIDPVDVSRLVVLASISAGSGLLARALGAIGLVQVARVAEGATSELRQRVYDRVLSQSLVAMVAVRSGEMTARLMNDTGVIAGAMRDQVAGLIRGAVTSAAALVVMFVLSWQLALATIVLLPPAVLVIRFAGRAVYDAQRDVQEQFGDVSAFAQEVLGVSGHLLVRSFGRAEVMRSRFERLNGDLRDRQVHVVGTVQRLQVLSEVVFLVATLGFVVVAGLLTADGAIAFPDLLAFGAVALSRFGPSLFEAANSSTVLVGSLAAWSRVFDVLDRVPERDTALQAGVLDLTAGEIDVSDVSFTYPGQSRPALDGISLHVRPGQLVALVGRSGAGKTTMASVLAGLVEPQTGHVRIDGQDLRAVSAESLADAVGIVLQDAFMFHASLRENLLIARGDATDDEIHAAIRAAHLEDVVGRLHDGLDTVVGERGHRLSGGEKQRLALARVILRDPPILILDEATSHLDSASENLVQLAVARLFEDRTSVVVAHRFSTIVAADLIAVFDDGRIVARGTHAELVAQGGLYAELHAMQSGEQPPGRDADQAEDGPVG